MSSMPLVSVSGSSYPAPYIPPQAKIMTPMLQKIESELKSQGTKAIGEKAYDIALKQLSTLLHHKNITVSTSLDEESGKQIMVIADGETGKTITQLPPQAAIEIADRAMRQHIGWLIDLMT